MKNKCAIALLLLVVCLLTPSAWPQPDASAGQAPGVHKIDPPNWWVNYTPELTLLLTGENLNGARVESSTKGLTALGAKASANGHYLFVHLKLSSKLQSGTARLRLTTSAGSTTVSLPLLGRADLHGGLGGDLGGHFEGFSRDDVIYLIMPDRFADGDPSNDRPTNDQPPGFTGIYDRSQPKAYHGGDLRGIRQHLDYLHDLGVTTLWLTPVWKNSDSDYHGYHVVDMYALDEHMGSMQEYQALVADAHKLGMKVLIDYVVNHTGPHHPWASDPPTPTWIHGTPEHHLAAEYKFYGLVDPHASPREYIKTLDGWFANKLPDLNPDDPELGLYLAQNAMWWTEIAQLDGFRQDTFPYSTRQFWSGWHERMRQVYPRINDVGEVFDGDPAITSFFEGGRKQFDGIDSGLATVFDFPLCFSLREVIIKGEPMGKIVDVLRHDDLYPHPETLVTFIGNHDQARFLGEEGSSVAKLKAAFSLLLTLRGIPQIYYGDEIALTGRGDPDNRRDFPGGFPGDASNAFTAGGRTPEQQDVFAYVQSLLALRKAHPALRTGKQWHIGWDDNYYAFLRESAEGGDRLLVVYNNAPKTLELNIPIDNTPLESAHQLQTVFGNVSAEIAADQVHVSLPARTLAVFSVH